MYSTQKVLENKMKPDRDKLNFLTSAGKFFATDKIPSKLCEIKSIQLDTGNNAIHLEKCIIAHTLLAE